MGAALARLRERYELVVIDTAPIGVVSDAFPLLGQVDGAMAEPAEAAAQSASPPAR